ncbi:DNA methyltransferase [Cellulosilyticum sp. ST5]|uniref:DNA methyltransferase n=1 Tax=Cellulosilyticum sp. ST5 TaxID=3055805 RepID=UPI00397738B9
MRKALVAGSATTLRACMELNRNSYGFEISKEFYKRAKEEMLVCEDSNYTQIKL